MGVMESFKLIVTKEEWLTNLQNERALNQNHT